MATDDVDCCSAPSLACVHVLYDKDHDNEEVRRCGSCGAFWFWRFHEHVDFSDDGEDEITVWYTRLTPDEAQRLSSGTRPDLSFLAEREAIQRDRDGVKRVKGQPTYPWT